MPTNSKEPELREGLFSYVASIKRDTVKESMSTKGNEPGSSRLPFVKILSNDEQWGISRTTLTFEIGIEQDSSEYQQRNAYLARLNPPLSVIHSNYRSPYIISRLLAFQR